ncbi:MAG TPA: hypothetical protein VHD56_09760 [Tepidisphaeraceae bacterium]|nr:hypothetical protein [Tepidisphaeraceae bacterium]
MDRISIAAVLLLGMGLWVHSYFTPNSDANPSRAAAAIELSKPLGSAAAVTAGPSQASAPAAPVFKLVRGAAGHWRLAQTTTGVWWFVSPQDKPEFLNTVTTVQPYQFGRDKNGVHFVSNDWTGKPGGEGDLQAWAKKTAARVLETGFKGLGAWSNPVFHQLDIPCTRDLNLSTWVQPGARRVYNPEWATVVEQAVAQQVVPLKDNKELVGYFIDNELDWSDAGAGPSHFFDTLSPEDPNRREVVKVIKSIWPGLEEFNREWHVDLKDWNEIDAWNSLPHDSAHAYNALFSTWLSHLSQDYFKLTCGLIRKYDSNHLILGVRFRGQAPSEVVRASRDLTDAQSINYYVSDARLDNEMFRMMYEDSGQPIIISEYSFHSLDGRSGDRNTVGFAAQVLDQQARADGYRLLTTRAARVPYIIGVDWFQWSDEPASGRASDGEDVNFGIVDIDDNPYELMARAVKETSPQLNPAHAESINDSQADVWRESFADKPAMHVPHLTREISLNGELSDWPSECRLAGVRHSQTVGLDRSSLPLPDVYLGWTDQGLYIGLQVFDHDISGAPAKGWWWTRDYVEFWLSTRPVHSDQNTIDVYSNQFFFVPNAWPGEDGLLGTVGQWHRPGDALKDNLIPHPDIRSAARVLPDRYVVEMFIPAKSMNGYDPHHQPVIAFNMHAHNFQQATDYFWSAPKEVMTQVRPGTWGTIYLDGVDHTNIARTDAAVPTTQAAAQ